METKSADVEAKILPNDEVTPTMVVVEVDTGETPVVNTAPIGRLRRVSLRDVWKHEAIDFTCWLEQNPDVLNDLLGLTLADVKREQAAGSFNVDLVAESSEGETVVIENQLEKSDHDHLGKLITYLAAFDAKVAVWIVADPRPEHIRAVSWLNESRSTRFYLLKLEAVQIDNSRPAPFLTLIVGPSAEAQAIGATKKELAERHLTRYQFWSKLLSLVKTRTKLHAHLSPTDDNWIATGAGKPGMIWSYVIRQHEVQVELYIDRGTGFDAENLQRLQTLEKSKDLIEQSFGTPLEWQRLEGKRACRIAYPIKIGGYKDEAKWPEIHEAMVDAMIRLEKSLGPFVAKL